MFYPEGKKIIPANIKFYLTQIAFAQLIMDDGSWARHGLIIQTNGFLPSDVEILVSAINNNFNLNCYMRFERNQPIIYIPAKNINTLKKVVLPHMHSTTHYKLGI